MARRRSMMAQRLQKMKGVSPEERDLLVRIGRTIDGAINNRGPTNPSSNDQIRVGRANPKLPTPSNITEERGIQSVKIQWDAVNSPILSYYQLIFQRLADGSTSTKNAYEPQLTFKGASGEYKVFIASVGRNGTRSLQKEFSTTLLDNVMLLEGAKNSVDSAGFNVSETVYVPKGYTVFAWAAFTLNDHAFENDNDIPKVVLKRSTVDDITTAATVQEIVLFPQSETVTSWEVTTGLTSGAITRPTNIGAPPDTGNTETSQTIMFTPLVLDDIDTGKDHTFFLDIQDRTTNDVYSLSIVLWVATGGRGFDINIGAGAHAVCLKHAASTMSTFPYKAALGTEWGSPSFTTSYWFKYSSFTPNGRTYQPFQVSQSSGSSQTSISASVTPFATALPPQVALFITMGQGDLFGFGDGSKGTNIYRDFPATSNLQGVLLPVGAKDWVHHVITYEAGLVPNPNRVRVYVNGVLAVSNDVSDGVNAFTQDQIGPIFNLNPKPDGTVAPGTNRTLAPAASALVDNDVFLWETAVWNSLLSPTEITAIYNSGNPINISLSSNTGSYSSAANLSIYWKYGQNKSNEDLTVGSTTTTDNLSSIWSVDDDNPGLGGFLVVDDYPGKT